MIVSIDIETTGLDPNKHSVLEIAAVIDRGEVGVDWCEVIHCYVIHEEVLGNLYALNMNKQAIQRIIKRDRKFIFLKPNQVAGWLTDQLPMQKYTIAGANFANFDLRFLEKLGWEPNCFHRIMDVGNLYWDYGLDGDKLPGMQRCLDRARIPGNVKHNAIDDCRDVIKLIRKKKND